MFTNSCVLNTPFVHFNYFHSAIMGQEAFETRIYTIIDELLDMGCEEFAIKMLQHLLSQHMKLLNFVKRLYNRDRKLSR